MTKIKICGIKEEAHALAVAEAGADFIGMVFAESPRKVIPKKAEKIVAQLKDSGASVETVGIFVNTPSATVKKIATACNLDWIQLSGDEPWAYCRELDRPIIKVSRVSRVFHPDTIIANLSYGSRILTKRKYMFLLDSNSSDKFGGSGMKFDWNLARPIARQFPVIIAGGLNPNNVAEAISVIKPWGVDVSSGVETKGVKDVNKIMKFIKAVRKADADNDTNG